MKYTLEHAARPTDIHQHLKTLYSLVMEVGAKTVIECGVNTGESTVALLEAVHATGGELYSVDIHELPEVRPMLERYGLTGRWKFQIADDIQFGNEWPKEKKADLIFIDTSHTYDHTVKEIATFDPILRSGGIMVFHDTESFYNGVQKPINEFRRQHKHYKWKNYKNCNGLGVLRKP